MMHVLFSKVAQQTFPPYYIFVTNFIYQQIMAMVLILNIRWTRTTKYNSIVFQY